MKRSLQEVVELTVFGLIALLVGLGLVWVTGWVLGVVGAILMFVATFLWGLLRFVVPVVIIAIAAYALVKFIQQRNQQTSAESRASRADLPPAERQPISTPEPRPTQPDAQPDAQPDTQPDSVTTPPREPGKEGDN